MLKQQDAMSPLYVGMLPTLMKASYAFWRSNMNANDRTETQSQEGFARTRMLLDIIFASAPKEECTGANGTIPCITCEEFDSFLSFSYQNRQGGKARNWTVDLQQAIFFTFRMKEYMVIRGERNGPVCFEMSRMILEDPRTGGTAGINFLDADPDVFPTEGTQDWMLCQKGC